MAGRRDTAGTWQIRTSTFFLLFLIFFIALAPFFPDIILIFAIVPIFILLRVKNHIKKFDLLDFGLMVLYTAIAIFAIIYFQLLAFQSVPWWQIILVGIAADVIASILGMIPVVGDFISGILVGFMATMVIGGIEGMLIGISLMVVSIIPGPSLGLNTAMIIIFKIISLIALK